MTTSVLQCPLGWLYVLLNKTLKIRHTKTEVGREGRTGMVGVEQEMEGKRGVGSKLMTDEEVRNVNMS